MKPTKREINMLIFFWVLIILAFLAGSFITKQAYVNSVEFYSNELNECRQQQTTDIGIVPFDGDLNYTKVMENSISKSKHTGPSGT